MKPSRRTITTRSRFIIFIQNWQANAAVLLAGCILFISLSCKDDASLVGFRKDAKLSTRYAEIPLKQSAFLYSPISTRNSSEETLARILVGRYNDPNFGNIEARGFFTIAPPLQSSTATGSATFVSLELQLRFDYYVYGSTDSTDQRIQVFEILDPIAGDGQYFNNSNINISPTPIGDLIFAPGPADLLKGWKTHIDTDTKNNLSFNVNITLTGPMGQSLLSDLISNPSLLASFTDFTGKYRGLALVAPQGDKIFGVSPVYTLPYPIPGDSKLTLTYMAGSTATSVDFPIYYGTGRTGDTNPVMSFTTLKTDRSATPLNGIDAFTDFVPPGNIQYVQSGTGVLTKFDLTNFYKYADTLDNVIINSAEIVLTNTTSLRPPQKVELRLLDSTNHFRSIYIDTVVNEVNKKANDPYMVKIQNGIFIRGGGTSITSASVQTDISGATIDINPNTNKVGSILMTEFFQQLVNHKRDPRRVRSLCILPLDGEFQKTLSSLVLDPSTTLKIYYSKPLIKVR